MQNLIELALCANLEILTGLRALCIRYAVPQDRMAQLLAALAEFRCGLLAMRAAPASLETIEQAQMSHAEITLAVAQCLAGRVPADLAAQHAATLEDFAIGLAQLAAETGRAASATSSPFPPSSGKT
jgi:hypothetical protein